MSDAVHDDHNIQVPKAAIAAAGAVFLFAILMAAAVRLTGVGGSHMTPPPAIVESHDVQFEDAQDGSVLVFDARDHRLIETIAPGTYGFVRVVMRGMARERKLAAISNEPSFRLTRYANGQLTLTDLANNRVIDLNAFGSSNLDAFAHIFNKQGSSK
jgi:putative photosynthetic complex assembly protein